MHCPPFVMLDSHRPHQHGVWSPPPQYFMYMHVLGKYRALWACAHAHFAVDPRHNYIATNPRRLASVGLTSLTQ